MIMLLLGLLPGWPAGRADPVLSMKALRRLEADPLHVLDAASGGRRKAGHGRAPRGARELSGRQ